MRLKKHIVRATLMAALIGTMNVSTMANQVLSLESAISRAVSSDEQRAVNSKYIQAYEEINKYNIDYFATSYRTSVLKQAQYEQLNKYLKDSIAYEMTKLYMSTVLTQKQLEVAQISKSIAEQELEQLKVKKELGFSTELEYKNKAAEIENLNAKITSYNTTLTNYAIDFRNLTNMDLNQYTLEDAFAITPITYTTPAASSHIEKGLRDYWKLKEELVDIQEDSLLDIYSISWGEYMKQEAQIEESKYNIEQGKESMLTTLLNYNNNLATLEHDAISMKNQIDTLEASNKVMELQYHAGLITKLEYEKQLNAKNELEIALFSTTMQHNLNKMLVEKPWILPTMQGM